jgi:hypothetical protein
VALAIANLGIELAGTAAGIGAHAAWTGQVQVKGVTSILDRFKNLFAANIGDSLHQFTAEDKLDKKRSDEYAKDKVHSSAEAKTSGQVQAPGNQESAQPASTLHDPSNHIPDLRLVDLDSNNEGQIIKQPTDKKPPGAQFRVQTGPRNLKRGKQLQAPIHIGTPPKIPSAINTQLLLT